MQKDTQIPDRRQQFQVQEGALSLERGNQSNRSINNFLHRVEADRSREGIAQTSPSFFSRDRAMPSYVPAHSRENSHIGTFEASDDEYLTCLRRIEKSLLAENEEDLKFLLAQEIIPEGEAEELIKGVDLCNYLYGISPAKCRENLFFEFLPINR